MSSDKANVQKLISAKINMIAAGISGARVGLVLYKPEAWAEPHRCFENTEKKGKRDSGCVAFGWTFHHRIVADIPGPGYLFMSHHSVWLGPDGCPIDVTPHPDAKHRPYGTQDSIVFMFDPSALPMRANSIIGPLPLQFFALD